MERNLFAFCCTVTENVLCFCKTPYKEKSQYLQYGKDTLLEIDGKVNNRGRMNVFLQHGRPRRDKSLS